MIRLRIAEGHYNWVYPDKTEFVVTFAVDGYGEIWETFDEAPDIDEDTDPEDVIDIIVKRSERWLYNSRREELKNKATAMMEDIGKIRRMWALQRSDEIGAEILRLQGRKHRFDKLAST